MKRIFLIALATTFTFGAFAVGSPVAKKHAKKECRQECSKKKCPSECQPNCPKTDCKNPDTGCKKG